MFFLGLFDLKLEAFEAFGSFNFCQIELDEERKERMKGRWIFSRSEREVLEALEGD